jgi:hypothetical protein
VWDHLKFIIENIKSIVFAGVVFWILIVLSLQLAGLIDIQAQCGGDRCTRFIEWAIKSAAADTLEPHYSAPLNVRVALLPDHR